MLQIKVLKLNLKLKILKKLKIKIGLCTIKDPFSKLFTKMGQSEKNYRNRPLLQKGTYVASFLGFFQKSAST